MPNYIVRSDDPIKLKTQVFGINLNQAKILQKVMYIPYNINGLVLVS